jgi:FkbM family methyltransferase
MMFPLPELVARHGMKVAGVVHAGAHTGQELEEYQACGIAHVLWIDANPELMGALNARVSPHGHVSVCACLGARDGDAVTFHYADSADGSNRGQSSSVLPLGTHRDVHPEVRYVARQAMDTESLATVVRANWPWPGRPNFLNLDLQGYELECLKGAEPILPWFDWIYTEINEDALYEGCALLPEISDWLGARGFRLAEKKMWGAQAREDRDQRWYGWGDALFLRAD